LCCPSRSTFLRGQYAHNHGIVGNALPEGGAEKFRNLGLDKSTVATWLDGGGYRTKFIGKYMNSYYDLYVPPGWDEWFALKQGSGPYEDVNEDGHWTTLGGQHSAYVFADKASDFIRRSSASPEPFFVMVNPIAPHTPPEVAAQYQDKFATTPLPKPPQLQRDGCLRQACMGAVPQTAFANLDSKQGAAVSEPPAFDALGRGPA
jgi:arylsulfatase A-like enzyme